MDLGLFSLVILIVHQIRRDGNNPKDALVVEKILRSLDSKFDFKAIVVEESKDLEKKIAEELMGSLQAYEQKILMKGEKSLEQVLRSKLSLKKNETSRGVSERRRFPAWRVRGGRALNSYEHATTTMMKSEDWSKRM